MTTAGWGSMCSARGCRDDRGSTRPRRARAGAAHLYDSAKLDRRAGDLSSRCAAPSARIRLIWPKSSPPQRSPHVRGTNNPGAEPDASEWLLCTVVGLRSDRGPRTRQKL